MYWFTKFSIFLPKIFIEYKKKLEKIRYVKLLAFANRREEASLSRSNVMAKG
jgi:hypothetical protein